jgi:hypothetical protein
MVWQFGITPCVLTKCTSLASKRPTDRRIRNEQMNPNYLDFEQPIAELEGQIQAASLSQ